MERELLAADAGARSSLARLVDVLVPVDVGGLHARAIARPATVAVFVPSDDEAWSMLFESLLVSRACDELTSRQGQRSDWLGIPLAGLDELLGIGPEHDG